MDKHFLFPNRFKVIGWILLLPSLVLGVASLHFEYELNFLALKLRTDPGIFGSENFTNEIAGILILCSLMFIGFSRFKVEDEYTMKIRLDSLLWGVYVNYGLIFLSIMFLYGGDFFTVMVYNIYTLLIIYILRFHYYYYLKR